MEDIKTEADWLSDIYNAMERMNANFIELGKTLVEAENYRIKREAIYQTEIVRQLQIGNKINSLVSVDHFSGRDSVQSTALVLHLKELSNEIDNKLVPPRT